MDASTHGRSVRRVNADFVCGLLELRPPVPFPNARWVGSPQSIKINASDIALLPEPILGYVLVDGISWIVDRMNDIWSARQGAILLFWPPYNIDEPWILSPSVVILTVSKGHYLAICSDASNLGSLAMGNFCSLYASLHDTKRTDGQQIQQKTYKYKYLLNVVEHVWKPWKRYCMPARRNATRQWKQFFFATAIMRGYSTSFMRRSSSSNALPWARSPEPLVSSSDQCQNVVPPSLLLACHPNSQRSVKLTCVGCCFCRFKRFSVPFLINFVGYP